MSNTDTEHVEDPIYEIATFAGGCFWCMEPPFDEIDGVLNTVVGYTGGHVENPTYEQVSTGTTGHYEAIQITFDPEKVSYKRLLDTFWSHINPTQANGQFVDIGPQYRTVIFYHSEKQKEAALFSKKALEESSKYSKPIVTEVLKAKEFYLAEPYHQNYYTTCPLRYQLYKKASGRET